MPYKTYPQYGGEDISFYSNGTLLNYKKDLLKALRESPDPNKEYVNSVIQDIDDVLSSRGVSNMVRNPVTIISADAVATPVMQRLINAHMMNDRDRGPLMYNPQSWMQFLKAFRKTQPRPHSLKEGAALVKAAGVEWRKRTVSNPDILPRVVGNHDMNTVLLGVAGLVTVVAVSHLLKR